MLKQKKSCTDLEGVEGPDILFKKSNLLNFHGKITKLKLNPPPRKKTGTHSNLSDNDKSTFVFLLSVYITGMLLS